MKAKSNFLFSGLMASLAITLLLSNCKDPEPLPENEIEDSEGLTIQLEWTTGGSITAAMDEADLELLLWKGETSVETSTSLAFEEVELKGIFADGEYQVEVKLYSSPEKDVDFTLYVIGKNSERTLEYTGSFNASDDAGTTFPDFIKITKTGETYVIEG